MTTTTVASTAARAATSTKAKPSRLADRDTLSLVPGLAPFAVTLGVAIGTLHFGALAGLSGGPLIYAGSAHLTVMTLFARGDAFLYVLLAGLVVNSRLLLYGAGLASRFADQPRWFRWVGSQVIIDPTFLMAGRRPELAGAEFRSYWIRLGLGVMAVWTAFLAVGLVAGPFLPPLPHLELVGVAMFIALLAPRITDRRAVSVAGAAALVAAGLTFLSPEVAVLGGAIAGMLVTRRADR